MKVERQIANKEAEVSSMSIAVRSSRFPLFLQSDDERARIEG